MVSPATWFPDLGSRIPGVGSSTREGRGSGFWTGAEKAEPLRSVWPYSPCPHHLQPKLCQAWSLWWCPRLPPWSCRQRWGSATRGHPGGQRGQMHAPPSPSCSRLTSLGAVPSNQEMPSNWNVLSLPYPPCFPFSSSSCFSFFPLSYPVLPSSCQYVNGWWQGKLCWPGFCRKVSPKRRKKRVSAVWIAL